MRQWNQLSHFARLIVFFFVSWLICFLICLSDVRSLLKWRCMQLLESSDCKIYNIRNLENTVGTLGIWTPQRVVCRHCILIADRVFYKLVFQQLKPLRFKFIGHYYIDEKQTFVLCMNSYLKLLFNYIREF